MFFCFFNAKSKRKNRFRAERTSFEGIQIRPDDSPLPLAGDMNESELRLEWSRVMTELVIARKAEKVFEENASQARLARQELEGRRLLLEDELRKAGVCIARVAGKP